MILRYISIAQAFISLDFFTKNDDLEPQQKAIAEKYNYSEYSLIEGILAYYSPAIYNIRLCGPYTKRSFKNAAQNVWFSSESIKDTSLYSELDESSPEEVLSYILCMLFPVIKEKDISIGTFDNNSLTYALNQFKVPNDNPQIQPEHQIINFLTGLLFCVSNREKGIKGRLLKSVSGIYLLIDKEEKKYKKCYLQYYEEIDSRRIDEMVYTFNLLLNIDDSKCSPLFNSKILLKAYIGIYLNSNNDILTVYHILDTEYLPFFDLSPSGYTLEREDSETLLRAIDKIDQFSRDVKRFVPHENQGCAVLDIALQFCGPDRRYNYNYEIGLFFFYYYLLYDPVKQKFTSVYFYDQSGEKKLSKISRIFNRYDRHRDIFQALREMNILLNSIMDRKMTYMYNNYLPNDFYTSSFKHIFCIRHANDSSVHFCGGLINFLKISEYLFGRDALYSSQVEKVLKKHSNDRMVVGSELLNILKSMFQEVAPTEDKTIDGILSVKTDTKSVFQNFEIEFDIYIKKSYEFQNYVKFRLGFKNANTFTSFSYAIKEANLIDNANISKALYEMYSRGTQVSSNLAKMIYFTYFSFSKYQNFERFKRWLSADQSNLVYELMWSKEMSTLPESMNLVKKTVSSISIENRHLRLLTRSLNNLVKSTTITCFQRYLNYLRFLHAELCADDFSDTIFNHFNLNVALGQIFINHDPKLNFYKLWISMTEKTKITDLNAFSEKIAFFMVKLLYVKNHVHIDNIEILSILYRFNACIDIMKYRGVKVSQRNLIWMPIFYLLYQNDLVKILNDHTFYSNGEIYHLFIEQIKDNEAKAAMRQSFVIFIKKFLVIPVRSMEYYLTEEKIPMFYITVNDVALFSRFLYFFRLKNEDNVDEAILPFKTDILSAFNLFLDKINPRVEKFQQAYSSVRILNELIRCQNITDSSIVSSKKTKIIEMAELWTSNLVGFAFNNDLNDFIDISRFNDMKKFLYAMVDLLVNIMPNFTLSRAEKKKILALSKNLTEEPLKISDLSAYHSQSKTSSVSAKSIHDLNVDFHKIWLDDIRAILKIYKNKF